MNPPTERDRRIGGRVKAAREQAGLPTREALAAALGHVKGLSAANIGKIERGERPLFEHEAPLFERCLEKPPGWFYADDEPPEETQIARLTQLVERLITEVEEIKRRLPPAG